MVYDDSLENYQVFTGLRGSNPCASAKTSVSGLET